MAPSSAEKPSVIYVGAEYCPFCAAERWSLIVALARFGTFSNLQLTSSSSTDSYPDTPTFSFGKAGYQSQYLDLSAVETSDRNGAPAGDTQRGSAAGAEPLRLGRLDTLPRPRRPVYPDRLRLRP